MKFSYRGESMNVDVESAVDRERISRYLSLRYNHIYTWFKEQYGSKNWVLYRRDMYLIERDHHDYLRCKFYTGRVELPINCSSCHKMFSETTIVQDFRFASFSNTTGIVDFSYAFYYSVFAPGSSLNILLDVPNVDNITGIFCNTTFYPGFDFSPITKLSKVKKADDIFTKDADKNKRCL